MPRPKKPGAPEPKRRSRNGCWPCKGRKIKCGEEHPTCQNCQRTGETCDYSIRLNWEGRRAKRSEPGAGDDDGQQLSPSGVQRQFTLISYPLSSGSTARTPQYPRAGNEASGPPPAARARSSSLAVITSGVQLPSPGMPEPGSAKRRSSGPYGPDDVGGDQDADAMSPNQRGFKVAGFVNSPLMSGPARQGTLSSGSHPRRHSVQGAAASTFQRPHKRAKSDQLDSNTFYQAQSRSQLSSPHSLNGASPHYHPAASAMSLGSPLTPAASSPYSDADPRAPVRNSPDFRRLTVRSLLAGSPGPVGPAQESSWALPQPATPIADEDMDEAEYTFHGYDLGKVDDDLGKNDDTMAISPVPSAAAAVEVKTTWTALNGQRKNSLPAEFGFGAFPNGGTRADAGGYYDKPVPIRIPKDLEPLPTKLQENPMNLLYFHHFLDHTARVLVPYDDPQSNPFRIILPQMAVRNDNLLSLLLAYSASHRARTLKQQEPAMRIALWVEDIFPALRQDLNDQERIVSNANLATAVMLASLEIISPTAFGFDIPWQKHLSLARALMKKRMAELRRMRSTSSEDQVCSFLWSWFAYLDVLGSLSGGPIDNDPSSTWLLDYGINDAPEDQHEIDCIMGFTNRCVHLLARIAELARCCDAQRIGPDHRVVMDWKPDTETFNRAVNLGYHLMDSLAQPTRPCRHIHAEVIDDVDRAEMKATNEAFHWAGLVHLHRRVLGKPSAHPDVQGPVQRILECMGRIRRGGTAETGFVFPMFTAGCDTADEPQRTEILERFRSVENSGMTQVNRARRLMQKVWETGQPFEALLSTEFIG